MQESRQVIMFHFVMYDMIKLSIFCQIIPHVSSEFHVELLRENLKQWFYYYPFCNNFYYYYGEICQSVLYFYMYWVHYWGVLFHWLLHNVKHGWHYMGNSWNPEPGSSVGDGETGELIYFVLYYIMWPRVIRRNNRVSQCEKILQR